MNRTAERMSFFRKDEVREEELAALADEPKLLDAEVEGVVFPSWDDKFGWRASGARDDELDGRDTETVFYDKEGKRIAYTIVGGDALDPPDDVHVGRRE